MSLPGDMEHFFEASFEALTDQRRLRWQLRLFERLVGGIAPRICDLPTGLGKTSVIPIWLIALAIDHDEAHLPPAFSGEQEERISMKEPN